MYYSTAKCFTCRYGGKYHGMVHYIFPKNEKLYPLKHDILSHFQCLNEKCLGWTHLYSVQIIRCNSSSSSWLRICFQNPTGARLYREKMNCDLQLKNTTEMHEN